MVLNKILTPEAKKTLILPHVIKYVFTFDRPTLQQQLLDYVSQKKSYISWRMEKEVYKEKENSRMDQGCDGKDNRKPYD